MEWILLPQTSESESCQESLFRKSLQYRKNFCITVDREQVETPLFTHKEVVWILKKLQKTPNEIYKLKISPGGDLLTHHARTIVYNLGLSGKTAKSAQKNILSIYKTDIFRCSSY